MLLWLLSLLSPAVVGLDYKTKMAPLRMELCKRNTWISRHYVVYACNYSNLHDENEAQRDLTPFACDPTDGVDTKMRRKLLFQGEEHKGGDGFIYECARDPKSGAVSYRAKSCYVDDERFLPGHFIKGTHNTIFLCYKDLDNIVRLRVRHPVHQACSPVGDDPRCRQGVAQTIYNSVYGYGEPFAYNPATGESLTVAVTVPPLASVNLAQDTPQLSAADLLRAIQGSFDPSVAHYRKTEWSPVNVDANYNRTVQAAHGKAEESVKKV